MWHFSSFEHGVLVAERVAVIRFIRAYFVPCSMLEGRKRLDDAFRERDGHKLKEGFPDLRCECVGRELSSLSSSLSKWNIQVIDAPALVISSIYFVFLSFETLATWLFTYKSA